MADPTDEELRRIGQEAYLQRSREGNPDATRVSDCCAARDRAIYNAGRAELTKAAGAILDLQSENKQLRAELEATEMQATAQRERAKRAEVALCRKTRELEEWQRRMAEATGAVHLWDYGHQPGTLEDIEQAARHTVRQYRAEIDASVALRAELAEKTRELEEERKARHEWAATVARAASERDDLNLQVQEKTRELEAVRAELETLREESTRMRQERDHYRARAPGHQSTPGRIGTCSHRPDFENCPNCGDPE